VRVVAVDGAQTRRDDSPRRARQLEFQRIHVDLGTRQSDRLQELQDLLLGDSAAIITTLLMSRVIGFNLSRPMLVSAFDWAGEKDELFRGQLACAVVALAKPDSARAFVRRLSGPASYGPTNTMSSNETVKSAPPPELS
jgi:hypothetical protein